MVRKVSFVLTEAQSPAVVLFQVLPLGLCGVGHIHLKHQRLRTPEGRLLLRLGLRPEPERPTHFWNRDLFTGGLREGEGMSRLCGARAAGGASGLLPLSIVWVVLPINCFANYRALALFCQLFCHYCPFALLLPLPCKKIRFNFYIFWIKRLWGLLWLGKKMGKLNWAWLPLPTCNGTAAAVNCPAKCVSSLSLFIVRNWSFWSSNMVYCDYWYWIPLFLFQTASSLLLRNVPAATMPVLIPNHQHDTLIPSPCLKGSYSLSAFEKLTPQGNKTEKDPLWWTFNHQATNRSYCLFYFHDW